RRIPAPARREDRRIEQRLHENIPHAVAVQIARDVFEREAVRLPEREYDRVLDRRGLQLEVELTTKALPQRQTPGAIDAVAERRMDDELHAAGSIEEALEH